MVVEGAFPKPFGALFGGLTKYPEKVPCDLRMTSLAKSDCETPCFTSHVFMRVAISLGASRSLGWVSGSLRLSAVK